MDWKAVVSSVAPWIGTALGGPLGGMAVTAVANALGLDDKTESAIKGALSGATPDDLLKIKLADQNFAMQMQAAGYQNTQALENIAASDRDSARKREMAVNDHTPRNLAYLVTAGFFGVLMLMMFSEQAQGAREVLLVLIGSLGTAWTTIMAYYFGSTAGGKLKSELLAKSTPS